MSNINKPNTFSSGTTISSSDVNDNFDTIYNDYNGNITSTNLADSAVSTSKIADGAVTAAKLASGIVESGWVSTSAPNTVSANGNRSYDLTFNSVDLTGTLSKGMRLKLTRTVTAPTQCADLESGSSQYFSKTSPTGLSFTTTFTCSAWIKLESYTAGGIIARRNADTEGWSFTVNSSGQIGLFGLRIASNNKGITSYQSVPLNKWVHVAACLDMTAGDTAAQIIWIDGIEVPRAYTLTGTATALVQGTTALVVGAEKSAGTNPFDGKIAQAAVFSACLSTATIRAMMNQTMTGSETNLVSAFTLNNTLNDLSSNANNLTANGGALATNADTPFTNPVTNTSITAGTTNYAIITAASFSTNTTLTVQIPEGDTLPTSGGISAVSYSTQKIPYGFPSDIGKWEVGTFIRVNTTQSSPVQNTWYNLTPTSGTAGGSYLTVPVGAWDISYRAHGQMTGTTNTVMSNTLSTASNTESDADYTERFGQAGAISSMNQLTGRTKAANLTTATAYYLNTKTDQLSGTTIGNNGASGTTIIKATMLYL